MHDHPVFQYLNEIDYLRFCEQEMKFREETQYPPFGRFVQIELKNTNEQQIDLDAEQLHELLTQTNEKENLDISVLGPAMPLVSRIKQTHIRHIFLKAKAFTEIYTLLQKSDYTNFESQIFIVPTP